MPIRPKAPKASRAPKPDAERLPVTPQWAALVVDAMKARGIGLRELARELGVSHATLGTVTRAETKTSPHVAAIAAALDIPSPIVLVTDRAKRLILALEAIEAVDPARATALLEEAEQTVARIEALKRSSEPAKKRTKTYKK